MSVDSTDELDKVLDSIWAYGVDWTEHKDESEHDLKVSTHPARTHTTTLSGIMVF